MKVLLLAGTREARALAGLLADEPGVEVEASLAGHTGTPAAFPCALRRGGFGGVDGLVDHLVASAVDVVVDATHPFAATMPWHAAEATDRVGVPRLRLLRPAWEPQPGDRWLPADDLPDAARRLRELRARRVLLTTGRLDLTPFLGLTGVHLVVRTIEDPAPHRAQPAWRRPAETTVIRRRGPFGLDEERAVLRDHAIDALVTKNAGGDDAKLVAAGEAGIPVIMVRRPPSVPGPAATTPHAALAWLRRYR